MGKPYPAEAGAYNYTHTRLANLPYEMTWWVILLALL